MKKTGFIYLFLLIIIPIILIEPVHGQTKAQTPNLVTIAATDGQATIAGAANVFTVYIDPLFKGLNMPGKATLKTDIKIREVDRDATLEEIFMSVTTPILDSLSLTQKQIILFCQNYPDKLRSNGLATFFLFVNQEDYYVAEVYKLDQGLSIRCFSLSDPYIWNAMYRHKFIVPVQNFGLYAKK